MNQGIIIDDSGLPTDADKNSLNISAFISARKIIAELHSLKIIMILLYLGVCVVVVLGRALGGHGVWKIEDFNGMAEAPQTFHEGDMVLCFHGPKLYEAKVQLINF